jgi:quinone-modifying oxidoreductase subunit QmoC
MAEGNRVEPDLNFIKYLKSAGGDTVKKCFQCATCSVMCPLSKDGKPFPRKEMIWAQWGLKDKLVSDPDVMLCHQCGDCSAYCPRGAKPGEVLGAIRAYAYTHNGFPSGLAKLASSGKNLPILIGIPALIIGIIWFLSGGNHIPEGPLDFGNFFGHYEGHGTKFGLTKTVTIIDLIFIPAFTFALIASIKGVTSYWKGMSEELGVTSEYKPSCLQFAKDFLLPAVVETIQHKRFNECGTNHNRIKGHLPLLLSFIGLLGVTGYSFIRKDVFGQLYPSLHGPIPLGDPMKIIANISAIALIVGVGILWANRAKMEEESGANPTFYDWFLIGEIMAVGVTGLCAELTRLVNIPVLAYMFYYLHLVSVFMLFLYMPYTKFAHMIYRITAMAFEKYRESTFVKPTIEN